MNPLDTAMRLLRGRIEDGEHPILERVERAVATVRARRALRGCELGERVYAYGPLHLVGDGRVAIGSRSFFRDGPVSTEIVCAPGGELTIGEELGANYGVSIECSKRISIGKRCMFGSFVRISDRGREGSAPVSIGDDVWIAHGAIIEPGVSIGDGAVVSAGAVVTSDVPPRTMAVGNPARTMPLGMTRGTSG